MRLSLLVVASLMIGCATWPEPEPDDLFYRAAHSWEGGHISNMIAVWGRPNHVYRKATATRAGTARWVRRFYLSDDIHNGRCSVTAEFDARGTILSVRVRQVPMSPEGRCSRANADILKDLVREPPKSTRGVA